jgi:hypothetical protein
VILRFSGEMKSQVVAASVLCGLAAGSNVKFVDPMIGWCLP